MVSIYPEILEVKNPFTKEWIAAITYYKGRFIHGHSKEEVIKEIKDERNQES